MRTSWPATASLVPFAGAFLVSFLTTSGNLLVPLAAVASGVGPAAVGLIMGSAFVMPVLLAVPLGRALSGAHPGLYVALSATGFVFAGLAAVYIRGVVALLAFQLVVGVGQLMGMLALQSLLAAMAGQADRARVFGWFSAVQSVGQLLGPLAAGAAFEALGPHDGFFLIVSGGLALLPVGLSLGRPKGISNVSAAGVGTRILGEPGVGLALLISAVSLASLTGLQTFLPVLLAGRGLDASAIAALLSARALASVGVRPFMGFVDSHISRPVLMVALLSLSAVSLLGVSFAYQYAWLLVMCLVLGVATGVTQPLSIVMLVDHLSVKAYAAALGVRLMANRLAQLVAPLLLGVVAARFGTEQVFAVMSAGLVASAAFVTWISRRRGDSRQRREAGGD